MLANSKLPTTFWAEAVNTACYVQNRVLVTKPHNKTPYELFLGRKLTLGFMRPFGCSVTILNNIDHLGKFDGKADEGFFIGYSINSKAFKVFNSRTRIVEENLHVQFSKNTPNIAGSGPNWLFDIDAQTKSMNYKLVVARNQSNGNAGTKACDDTYKARMEKIPGKYYILLPLWTANPSFSQILKSSPDVGFKPSSDDGKKVDEDSRNSEGIDQEKEDNVNITNNVNAANINEVNAVYDEDVGAKTDMNNLDAFMPVSPILTTRVHKDHPVEQIIGDLNSAPQTKRMTKNLEEHGRTQKGNSCIEGSKLDRGYAGRASTIQITRSLDFGYTQEERIDYDEVFAPVARIEAIRLFLAYALFKDFMVYQMDVRSAFLYGKIKEEVYDYKLRMFVDPDFPVRVYKVEKALYGLHQAPRAWYETLSTYLLDNEFQRGKIDKTLFIKRYKAYTDSDYARASLDRKSTIGGCQFLGCRLISWQCKKQTVVGFYLIRGLGMAGLEVKPPFFFNIGVNMKVVMGVGYIHFPTFRRDQEDSSKHGRKIDDIDKDAEITLIDETQGRYGDGLMFDTGVLDDEEVFARQDMDEKEINVAKKKVSTADPVTTAREVVTTASPIETTTADDLTLTQTLIEIRSEKSKVKGVVIGDQSKSTTRTRPQQLLSKDKGKGIMEEPEKPTKKKDQIRHDEEVSQRLQAQMQAELEEEDRLELVEVPDDGDDVTIDATPLSTKSLSIVDYKIHKEGKKTYYQIIKADGSSKMYLVFSHMLKSLDIEDLETLWKLVKAKHGSTRPEKGYERVLWGDLKTMFDPHIEDQVWRNQQDYRVLDWKTSPLSGRLEFVCFSLKDL
ncbi:putative ribonuclease H-like domain-containing protein [Tanacetum coccineum]